MSFPLEFTDEVARATADVYEKIGHLVSEEEWRRQAPYVHAIRALKAQKNAIVLAHNYQIPALFYGVADITGDSLVLARRGQEVKEETIVVCGVHFMAETAKLLSPNKKVLIPDPSAGCSLADSITAQDVLDLKAKYPDAAVVTYVNTSAAVKAVSDICCTSSNALKIVEALPEKRIVFLPDRNLGAYIASQTEKEIILWNGSCEVHEQFEESKIINQKKAHAELEVWAHPECPPDILRHADRVGSTSAMVHYVERENPQNIMLLTEGSLTDNLRAAHPHTRFVSSPHYCPYMQKITLEKVYFALQEDSYPVEIDSGIADQARRSLARMLELS